MGIRTFLNDRKTKLEILKEKNILFNYCYIGRTILLTGVLGRCSPGLQVEGGPMCRLTFFISIKIYIFADIV